MSDVKVQKIKLLKIWEILNRKTDELHPISTQGLIQELALLGIKCERRTIYADIDSMQHFGYGICNKRKGHDMVYWVKQRQFDLPEIKIIMDAIQSSKFIPKKMTEELLNKLADLGGSSRTELMKRNVIHFNAVKHSNAAIYEIVDSLERAIENKKKITFNYFLLNFKGQREYKHTDPMVYRALSITKDDAATMILFWIELFLRKQKKYDVNALEYTFTLEHIMPKSWEKNWSQVKIIDNGTELDVNSDEGKTYRNEHIQSIGNKTLLTSRINASVKNSCFKDKVKGNGNNQSYQNHTSLILTKSIVDNYTDGSIWDEKQIEIRQNKLFDLFKKVWPNFKKDNSTEEHEVMTKQTQSAENTDIEKTIDDYGSDVFDDANKLLEALTISQQNKTDQTNNTNFISLKDRFIDEIKNGKIYYSYKPVFIKAIFDNADENGTAYIYDIAMYFTKFYNDRKENGITVENPESVVCKGDFSIDEALKTIKQYPLDIYQKTNTVKYNAKDLTVSIVKEVWELLTADEKKDILSICDKRIESYYSKLI